MKVEINKIFKQFNRILIQQKTHQTSGLAILILNFQTDIYLFKQKRKEVCHKY